MVVRSSPKVFSMILLSDNCFKEILLWGRSLLEAQDKMADCMQIPLVKKILLYERSFWKNRASLLKPGLLNLLALFIKMVCRCAFDGCGSGKDHWVSSKWLQIDLKTNSTTRYSSWNKRWAHLLWINSPSHRQVSDSSLNFINADSLKPHYLWQWLTSQSCSLHHVLTSWLLW